MTDIKNQRIVTVWLYWEGAKIMRDGLKRDGPHVWSSMVVKRLEDDCAEDLRTSGFPEYLVDQEPEVPGEEVVVENCGVICAAGDKRAGQ